MRKTATGLVMLAMGLALPGYARAAAITYSTTFSVGDFYSGEVAGIFSVPLSGQNVLSLNRFNGPGTLQGVEISFESTYVLGILEGRASDIHGEGDVIPFPPFMINERNDAFMDATVDGTLQIQLFDPSSSSGTTGLPAVNAACAALNTNGDAIDCIAQPFPSFVDGVWNGTMPINALGLSPFEGADPINLLMVLSGSLFGICDFGDLNEGDECYLSAAGLGWTGSVTVRYTYAPDGDPGGGGGGDPTPVPEPATMVLMGIGLVGVAARRHRDQRHSPWSTKADQ